jgi:hypothetical protein
MTSVTRAGTRDYWPAYSSLEGQLRDVARMATITRFYAHEIQWPKLTHHQYEEICRLLFLVTHVEDMAEALVKTYDAGFRSDVKSAERGRNREHNGIQRSPERNRTAAEMSFSTAR